jgi:hypothetical protein
MADPKEPKKETVRITLPPRPAPAPGGATSARETVRINLPTRPPSNGIAPRPPQQSAPLPSTIPDIASAPARPPIAQSPLPPAPAKQVRPPPFVPPPRPPASVPAPAVSESGAPAPASVPLPPKAPVAVPSPPKFNPPPAGPVLGAVSSVAAAMPSLSSMPGPSPGPKKETARITVLPDPPAKPASTVQMKKTQPLITMPQRVVESAPIVVAPPEPAAVIDEIPISICWGLLGGSTVILLIQIWTYFA